MTELTRKYIERLNKKAEMMKIRRVDLGKSINKSASSVSYISKTNKDELELLELGYIVKEYGYNKEQLIKLLEIMEIVRNAKS